MSRLHGRGSRVIRHTRDQNIRVLNSGDSFYRADRNTKPVQLPTLFDVQLHKCTKPPLIVDRRSQFLGLATHLTNGFAQCPSRSIAALEVLAADVAHRPAAPAQGSKVLPFFV